MLLAAFEVGVYQTALAVFWFFKMIKKWDSAHILVCFFESQGKWMEDLNKWFLIV